MQKLREICNKLLAMADGEGSSTNLKPKIFELACMMDQAINELDQELDSVKFEPLPALSIDRTVLSNDRPALSIERPGRYEWTE